MMNFGGNPNFGGAPVSLEEALKGNAQSGGAAPAGASGMEQFAAAAPLIAEEAKRKFDTLLARMIHGLLGDGNVADEAIETGSFSLDGTTVVLRLNPENDLIEFFCDMGLPPNSYETEAIFRKLLQANLCSTYPGVSFGVHPESQRVVSYSKIHIFMVDEEGELCLENLKMLVEVAKQVRDW